MIIIFIAALLSGSGSDALWHLRSGSIPENGVIPSGGSVYAEAIRGVSSSLDTGEIRAKIAAGRKNLLFSLAGRLVSSGHAAQAELCWTNPLDPPATRGDLLAALAWFGRFRLYSIIATRPEVPGDMRGRLHDDHCAAVCSAGWMVPRDDGLFHPEELVCRGDLVLLSQYFPAVRPGSFLPLSHLDNLPVEDADVQ